MEYYGRTTIFEAGKAFSLDKQQPQSKKMDFLSCCMTDY